MANKSYIVLSKTEWTRLKNQSVPGKHEGPEIHQFESIRRTLDEKSRTMREKWPNTVEKRLKDAQQKHMRQRKALIEDGKRLDENKAKESLASMMEAVHRAKKIIFQDTSYGRQLVSAAIQSKVLEEQELQRKLNKELQQLKKQRNKELEASERSIIDLNKDEQIVLEQRKKKEKIDEYNMLINELQNKDDVEEKEREKQLAKEEARITQKLLDYEEAEKVKCKPLEKQAQEQHVLDQQIRKEMREKREALDDAITLVWKKHIDRKRCMEKEVSHKIHLERYNTEANKKVYEVVSRCLESETRQYREFIQKGIDKAETLEKANSTENMVNAIQKKTELINIAQQNKSDGEEYKTIQSLNHDPNKCVCLRQSLFTKPCADQKEEKYATRIGQLRQSSPPPWISLQQALKARQREPSPWSGGVAADEYFAKQADEVVNECSYKHLPLKVVKEYYKNNGLKSTENLHLPTNTKISKIN